MTGALTDQVIFKPPVLHKLGEVLYKPLKSSSEMAVSQMPFCTKLALNCTIRIAGAQRTHGLPDRALVPQYSNRFAISNRAWAILPPSQTPP